MLNFYKKEIHWFTLKYVEVRLEEEYQEDKQKFQIWNSRIFVSIFLLLAVALWLAGIVSPDPFALGRVIVNIMRLLLIPGIFIMIWIFPKLVEEIVIGVIIFFFIGYVELNRDVIIDYKYIEAYVYGLLIQTFCLALILLRVDFKRLFFLLLLQNIYAMVRMFHVEKLDYSFMKATVLHMTNFFILISFSYGRDLFDRKVYFEKKKYHNILMHYETLIKEIMPISVIIYDENDILFSNRETRNILKIHNNDFSQITLNLMNISIKESSMVNYDTQNRSHFYYQEVRGIQRKSFLDLMRDTIPSQDIISCVLVLPSQGENSKPEENLNIRLKISGIFWNEKVARIVFFSEDHSANEINLLNQKEKYVNRFLATISHEFRTPLNGIIGMLSFVRESCQENELKSRYLFI